MNDVLTALVAGTFRRYAELTDDARWDPQDFKALMAQMEARDLKGLREIVELRAKQALLDL